jgi:hypothetical protein
MAVRLVFEIHVGQRVARNGHHSSTVGNVHIEDDTGTLLVLLKLALPAHTELPELFTHPSCPHLDVRFQRGKGRSPGPHDVFADASTQSAKKWS